MFSIVFEPRPWHWIAAKLLGRFRPSVYWGPAGAVRQCDLEIPDLPGPDWVLLRTRLGGICGTDLGVILMKHHPGGILRAYLPRRVVLGHENVAEVVRAGPEASEWSAGQRVCVDSSLGCRARGVWPPCKSCAAGLFCLCENFDRGKVPPAVMLGVADFAGGSWSEFFVAHKSQLHAVPDWMDDEQAVLIDPVACAVHGVLRCWPQRRGRVAVLGGGIIALATIAALRALGWTGRIDALLRRKITAERAAAAGADRAIVLPRSRRVEDRLGPVADALGARLIRGRYGNATLAAGYETVYDAVGSGESISDAARLASPRGTVALLGTPQIVIAELTGLWLKELRFVGCYGRQIETHDGRTQHTYRIVMEMAQQSRLPLEAWRPELYPADRWRDALATAAGRAAQRPVKVALDFRNM